VEAAKDPDMEPSGDPQRPRQLRPASREEDPPPTLSATGGAGDPPGDAGRIVDALKASADQELTIAERVSGKARQAFALAAGVFVVAQTVAFGNFEANNLSDRERDWILGLAIAAVVLLGAAAFATIKADATVDSRDLPLGKLEDDLNAAYEGDPEVTGRLGGYYLGVVRSRRKGNRVRVKWYKRARIVVALSLLATVAELILSLAARTT
jgi:hypothetical protein